MISYAYLWHHEGRAGRKEGAKDRPCVIVLTARRDADGRCLVRVVPVTHRPPDDPAIAIELPRKVKRHLGLDDDRSWIVVDEVNEFVWPGFDLRPIGRRRDGFAYGFLPPRLFEAVVTRLATVWNQGRAKATSRD